MNYWTAFARMQTLAFLREPAAAVFNLAVPFLIVFLQGAAFGDTVIGDSLPGYRVVDVLPLTAAVMYTMTIGLFGMSIGVASMAESRTLAGARLRRGGPTAVVTSYAAVLCVLLLLGLTLATLLAALVWGIKSPAHPGALPIMIALCSACFLALGAVIAAIVRSARSAQAVASALFFPMLFLSDTLFPLADFPRLLAIVGRVLPGFHVDSLLAYAWISGEDIPWFSIGYLLALTATATVAAVRLLTRREDL